MPTKTKNPALAGTSSPGLKNTLQTKHSATPRKRQRVLRAFLAGHSFNQIETTRDLRDWCLHSTEASLEARGVRIDRHNEVVPGQFGAVNCKRYRLAPEPWQRAFELCGDAT